MARGDGTDVGVTLAIVQARMGSTRLPGKSLMRLAGLPLVQHVARRTGAARLVDKLVFAIPDTPENDVLHDFVSNTLGLDVYRGANDDVLARFAAVVRAEQPDVVVRITADDPLKDPAVIDRAIALLLRDPTLTYVSNSLEASYPEGLDVEVVRAWALLEAASEATLPSDREHVTPFIWRQPSRYRVGQFRCPRDLGAWRWTLDTAADLAFLAAVLDALPIGPEFYAYERVVELLESVPELYERMPAAPRSVQQLDQREVTSDE